MSRRTPALAAALLLAACGGGNDSRAAPAVRLLDRLAEVEIVGEAPAPESKGVLRPSRLVRPRDRRHLARVALEHGGGGIDERLSLVVPTGTALRFPLAGRGEARLRLGLGAGPAAADGAPLAAVARWSDPSGTRVLFERRAGAVWDDIDLPLVLDGEAVLELAARGPAGTWVAFSSPELAGERPPGWDVVLISLDTLRADHLGCYGYSRPTSPRLDAFAAAGFRFARAFSPAPWTLPSHQALFNGLYPRSHGDLRSPPLARVLWLAGYRTQAHAGGGVMDYRMGSVAQGFDSYRAHDWIRDLDGLERSLAASEGRPRFVFLHTYEPHDPYIDTRFAEALPAGRIRQYFDKGLYPPIRDTITDDEKRYIEALYDGDIAFTDERLGELFDRLAASGALARSIVAVVSDHGEQFWEHGSWRHGQNLYDEQIHVPMILSLPEDLRRDLGLPASGVVDDQVRLVDLYPTLLELLGIELVRPVQGRSLVPLLGGAELEEAESLAEDLNLARTDSKAVRFRGFKLLRSRSTEPGRPPEWRELYDLRRDPGELVNLIDERPEVAAELLALLERLAGGEWEVEGEKLETDELDPDLRRDLEALGYIGN